MSFPWPTSSCCCPPCIDSPKCVARCFRRRAPCPPPAAAEWCARPPGSTRPAGGPARAGQDDPRVGLHPAVHGLQLPRLFQDRCAMHCVGCVLACLRCSRLWGKQQQQHMACHGINVHGSSPLRQPVHQRCPPTPPACFPPLPPRRGGQAAGHCAHAAGPARPGHRCALHHRGHGGPRGERAALRAGRSLLPTDVCCC